MATLENLQAPAQVLWNPITFHEPIVRPFVDEWVPEEEDYVLKTVKGAIICDISSFYGYSEPNLNLDTFNLQSKRSYNSEKLRKHTIQYLNYFEKFYDPERELISVYATIKYMIDYVPSYTKDAFFYDIRRYIIYGPLAYKAQYMTEDNYQLSLSYNNKKNPALQYSNHHAILLLKISLMMNMMIPLLCHFMSQRRIKGTTDFLLEIYDDLLHIDPDVDMYAKLYETAITNVERVAKRNQILFDKQDIRGLNNTIHSVNCVTNIIINIIAKYVHDSNAIHLNSRSILRNTSFQITDIEYEYAFYPLSSSNRDEDMNSDFDIYMSFLQKADSALYLQNEVACRASMDLIEMLYGPFDEDEVRFVIHRLSDGSTAVVNSFQKEMVFNIFYKYFGDPSTINCINIVDYAKLIIAARNILESAGMVLLPYIVSAKVERLAVRKNVNKKELTKLELSSIYQQIKDKYRNDKIEKQILSIISTIIFSDFEVIDFQDPELDGQRIQVIPEIILEELPLYISLI